MANFNRTSYLNLDWKYSCTNQIYRDSDGPKTAATIARSACCLLTITTRVPLANDAREVFVHLAHIKALYKTPSTKGKHHQHLNSRNSRIWF